MARILTFDVETCGVQALTAAGGFILCFGWKWSDETEAHSIALTPEELMRFDDSRLLREASAIFEDADLLCGHFAEKFDRKFINGRLLINELPPLPNTRLIDTCLLARSVAKFGSNSLDSLCITLNLKNRKNNRGLRFPWSWMELLKGDSTLMDKMQSYCEKDCLATEELYLRLRPFSKKHPRLVADKTLCPKCGGKIIWRGTTIVSEHRYRRYSCTVCGHWGRDNKAITEEVLNARPE